MWHALRATVDSLHTRAQASCAATAANVRCSDDHAQPPVTTEQQGCWPGTWQPSTCAARGCLAARGAVRQRSSRSSCLNSTWTAQSRTSRPRGGRDSRRAGKILDMRAVVRRVRLLFVSISTWLERRGLPGGPSFRRVGLVRVRGTHMNREMTHMNREMTPASHACARSAPRSCVFYETSLRKRAASLRAPPRCPAATPARRRACRSGRLTR